MTEINYTDNVTVQLIDSMGDVDRIVQAARVSTAGADSRGSKADTGLVRYLFNNKHASPFEHVIFTFYVQAPVFVTREILRHRISSFNEESGRYKQMEPHFYIPGPDRPLIQVGKVGNYDFIAGTEEQHQQVSESHIRAYEACYKEYRYMLDEVGAAREVARNVLPFGLYSSMYYTANLRSILNFLSLRADWGEDAVHPSSPTYEIDLVAREIAKYLEETHPLLWELFKSNGYQAV